jgi:putative ABC transport system permease protein
VVGVVQDVIPVDAELDSVVHQIYRPLAQVPTRANEIAVRVEGVPLSVAVDRIREAMSELDRDLPVRSLQPAEVTIGRVNYQLGVLRDVLIGMAALGLGLAALGIYGIISRTIAQRTGEFAIRLALGACVRDLTRIVLVSGIRYATVGAAIGMVGAIAMARLLTAAFPGVDTSGFVVLVVTTLVLIGVALLASLLPARRAGRVDAMSVLRAQ